MALDVSSVHISIMKFAKQAGRYFRSYGYLFSNAQIFPKNTYNISTVGRQKVFVSEKTVNIDSIFCGIIQNHTSSHNLFHNKLGPVSRLTMSLTIMGLGCLSFIQLINKTELYLANENNVRKNVH